MSRLCGKPTCSAPSERWFDFAPNEQRVIERSTASELAVGLCAQHSSRFSVPSGWTLVSSAPTATTDSEPRTGQIGGERPPANAKPHPDPHGGEPTVHRSHQRDAPWFLALSDSPTPVDTAAQEPSLVLDREPSAGSLLHRAFHGPDREIDVERARHDAATTHSVDELTPRREKRSTNGYDSIELPFPPLESESHVAVS